MQFRFLLVCFCILLNLATGDISPLPVGEQKSISIHFKNTAAPFWEPRKEKDPATDIASLKQSNWYAEAIKEIEESEYEIKYHEAGKDYTSSNRKYDLRSFFTSSTFTLQPRNDNAADKWRLQLTTLGVFTGGKLIYQPSESPIISLDKKNIRFSQDDHFICEYNNTKEGIRQNFIINDEPSGKPRTLSIKLQTNPGWFVNKVHDEEIHFAKAGKDGYEKKITYNSLKAWDANYKELPVTFSVKQDIISIDVNTLNAAYPLTIDPLSSTASALLEVNQTNGGMGCAVASAGDVNGDGYSDVIVGAYAYFNPAPPFQPGAAFVFHGSATGISTTVQAYLKCDQTTQSNFGISVATAGDVNNDGYSDVIVGADNYTNGQSQEGAAFVFLGSVSGVNTAIQAQLEMNQSLAAMGRSVASAGDVNADGYSDVIVGAVAFDNGQSDEGAVFIYHGDPSGIIPVVQTQLEGNAAGLDFGSSVASAGDVNGDGYSDVIVGVWAFSNGQSWEGAAFVFHGSGAGITTAIQTILESNQVFAFLGQSVSSAGDVNGDGYSDVIVGSMYFDNGNTDEGVAFVYHGSASGVTITIQAQLEINQNDARFGESVSCAGDVNGDGYSDVVVGAFLYDNGQSNEGGAFVYHGSSTGINTTIQTQLECNQVNAQFGSSVCAAGDVNGDGYSDVIAGATYYDNGNTDEGAAFVYHGSPAGLISTGSVTIECNQINALFGGAVACAGDVNGDGYSDVIVGARYFDNGQADEGAAFVFHGSVSGINITIQTQLECNVANAFYGSAVAGAGDVNGDGYSDVMVWADQFPGEAVLVYHGSSSGITTTVQTLLTSLTWLVGVAIASAGDVNGDGYGDIIIGNYRYANGQIDEGGAFLFHGSPTGITTTIQTQLEINQTGAYFGGSVASAGDVNGDGYTDVIVGAPYYDNGNTNEGAAFLFYGSATGITTMVQTQLEGNQDFVNMGSPSASAGDVNGDGYSDVIVGVSHYSNGQLEEGAFRVFHGSSTGITTTIQAQAESNQDLAYMGSSVSSAGDVNGDGYSDIIVGAFYFDNALSNVGKFWVFHGSPAGINTSIQLQVESNQANAQLGNSVASAGDVNGDGYSDIIVGAPGFTNGQAGEGVAFVYMGNSNGGLRNNLRLYNQDLVTPIGHLNVTQPNLFGAGLFAKSPLGRLKGKLVWEVKKQGMPFSGNPITNSTAFLDKQTSFTGLGLNGIELKSNVQKVGSRNNKVRVRVEYDKVTAITGQVYGPWRYPAGYTMGAYGQNSVPLPITLISFNGQFINADDVQLNWITTNEINMQLFTVERSTDGINFTAMGSLAAKGIGSNRADYSLTDKNVQSNLLYYRLKLVEKTGEISYTKIITLSRSRVVLSFIAPNPVTAGGDAVLNIQAAVNNMNVAINMYNAQGQLVFVTNKILQNGRNQVLLSTKEMARGMYLVSVTGDGMKETYKLLVQ